MKTIIAIAFIALMMFVNQSCGTVRHDSPGTLDTAQVQTVPMCFSAKCAGAKPGTAKWNQAAKQALASAPKPASLPGRMNGGRGMLARMRSARRGIRLGRSIANLRLPTPHVHILPSLHWR